MDRGNAFANDIGAALADALIGRQLWVHRRVELLQFGYRERGMRRVSLDCTPPPDPRLAHLENERTHQSIGHVAGPVVIPVAMMAKGPLREFDLRSSTGEALPVLLKDEATAIVAKAVLSILVRQGIPPNETLTRAVSRIISAPAEVAKKIALELIAEGTYHRAMCLEPADLQGISQLFLEDLAENFVLLALLPSKLAGTRTIIKWRTNWHIQRHGRVGAALASVGFRDGWYDLPTYGADMSKSYHLEVEVPPDLDCYALDLPTEGAFDIVHSDRGKRPVAHAYARYPTAPGGQATALLSVPWSGWRLHALLASGFVAIVCWLALLLPGAQAALQDSPDGAAALLLIAPASLIALAASSRQDVTSQALIAPLRLILFSDALALTVMAASIVGALIEPWVTWLWSAIACIFTAVTVLMAVGGIWEYHRHTELTEG